MQSLKEETESLTDLFGLHDERVYLQNWEDVMLTNLVCFLCNDEVAFCVYLNLPLKCCCSCFFRELKTVSLSQDYS